MAVGVSSDLSDEVKSQTEAIRDALRKVVALVGYGSGDDALRKRFLKTLVDSLASGKSRGVTLEGTSSTPLGGGQVRTHVLVRCPNSLIQTAKAELVASRPRTWTVEKAAESLSDALARELDDHPVVGTLSIGRFTPVSGPEALDLAAQLRGVFASALGRARFDGLKLSTTDNGTVMLDGRYRAVTGSDDLLLTIRLIDRKRNEVRWTSPELRVSGLDLSDLRPATPEPVLKPPPPAPAAAPATAAPTPAPVSVRQPARPLSVQQKVGKPRIMVVLPEVHLQRAVPDPAGETEIIRLLLEGGYKVVDQSESRKVRENESLWKALQSDSTKLAALGRQNHADIIVFGEAFSDTAERSNPGVKVQARVEARAVRCDTAEILVAHGLEAEAAESSEAVAAKKALRQAGTLVGKYFVQQLATRWAQEASGSRSLEILIADISYGELVKLKEAMRNEMPSLDAIHQRDFESNIARFEVDYAGDPQELVDELVRRDLGGCRLELVRLTAGKVEMRLK
jgi:hypothetical protein